MLPAAQPPFYAAQRNRRAAERIALQAARHGALERRELSELDYADIAGLVAGRDRARSAERLQIEISDGLLTAACPGLEATLEALDRMGM